MLTLHMNNKKEVIRNRFSLSDLMDSGKQSICCKDVLLVDTSISDVGVCKKCKRLSFNKDNQQRLAKNRHQGFKKIADDGLYNNTWRKRAKQYRLPKNRN